MRSRVLPRKLRQDECERFNDARENRSSNRSDEKIAQHSNVTLQVAPKARRDLRRTYPEWAEDVL